MKFVPYQLLDGRPSVVVDGSPAPGTVLNVTHWPGYPPPAGIEDDLSAQMAFRLLERPDLVPGEAEAVSNNHFDQDGLVSIYALVAPDDAVQRRTFLEDVAFAGDLAICRDRDAARVSMVLSALANGDNLPADYTERTGALYEDVLGRLPELCDHVERHRDVWGDEDATLEASDAAFKDGRAVIEERPDLDLAVVTLAEDTPEAGGHRFSGDWVSGLHPMAVNTRSERVTLARLRGRRYDVELRYEGWVQLQSRPVRPRRDLAPLAARLQDEETGDAVWSATPVSGLLPRLHLGHGQESSISPDHFLELLTDPPHRAPGLGPLHPQELTPCREPCSSPNPSARAEPLTPGSPVAAPPLQALPDAPTSATSTGPPGSPPPRVAGVGVGAADRQGARLAAPPGRVALVVPGASAPIDGACARLPGGVAGAAARVLPPGAFRWTS